MEPKFHSSSRRLLDGVIAEPKGSFIFYGDEGLALAAARWVAQRLNCLGDDAGPCRHCRQITDGNFPDLLELTPEDSPSIKIEQIRGLLSQLSLSPYYPAGKRLVILHPSASIGIEAQNSLLKTLEEPPRNTLIILIAEALDELLETVRSRTQDLYFPSETHEAIDEVAAEKLLSLSPLGRLLQTKLLSEEAATAVADNLAESLRQTARQSGARPQLGEQMAALERYRRRTKANVAPKAALEALMLEL